jgi:Tfp pilus assembly protein PilX
MPSIPTFADNRGMAMTLVLTMAVVAALAAYGNLMLAVQQARSSEHLQAHALARYAAEAGYIIARERLWVNSNYCTGADASAPGVIENFDGNADGTTDLTIELKVYPCVAGATRTIESQVIF